VKTHSAELAWIWAGFLSLMTAWVNRALPFLEFASLLIGIASGLYGIWTLRQYRKAELKRQAQGQPPDPLPPNAV
jgi:positive regulator of sigma E activity